MLFCFLILAGIEIFSSCSKTAATPKPPASIGNFSFQKSANPIQVNSEGMIFASNINIFLPPGTDPHALIASFSFTDNSKATINGVAQVSNVTPNDFSKPVIYTITSPTGGTRTYTISLTTDIPEIDNQVQNYMTKYNVPGLSFALTQNERLIYAKSYGKADEQNNVTLTNSSLFRIASLSKQITSVTIMRLMEQGKLHMEDKVFGPGAVLGTDFGTLPYGQWITDITIDELLHHSEGGWSNDGSDPMFTNPTLTAQQLITWTLNNRPLVDSPSKKWNYSNFGYCILGRVIEKLTGLKYDSAAKSLVLIPSGISDMVIAGNTLQQKLPDEVVYYGQDGDNPYIYNVTRMDSHGGWLASATDLARFLVHVDGFNVQTDIISPGSITTMTTGSTANSTYACGWQLNGSNWYHTGDLPGTQTEQARIATQGQFNFVILTNTRNNTNSSSTDLDNIFGFQFPILLLCQPMIYFRDTIYSYQYY